MQLDNAKHRPSEEFMVNTAKIAPRSSIMTGGFKQEYLNIKIDSLLPFKNQARKTFDPQGISDLAVTIKEHGVRQPLTVVQSKEHQGCYEVVSGERRLRAAKVAGLERVPCIVINDYNTAEEIAIIENVQRKDLHPLELMSAYKSLLDKNICNSMQSIADKIGTAKSSVVEIMNLQNLPEETRVHLLEHDIKSRRLFRALLKEDSSKHAALINDYQNPTDASVSVSQKERGLTKKATILSVIIEGDKISLAQNKTKNLSEEDKDKMREMLYQVLTSLDN